jgi:hypothetical protein
MSKSNDGWKRKFKGSEHGGAYIYTHPNALDGRAIVVNGHGVTFNGETYESLEAAKAAALSLRHHSSLRN